MRLVRLALTNFRNFRRVALELPPGPVVVQGGNAVGKTALLEAVYALAIGKSFRSDHEGEVVNWDAEGEPALVDGTFVTREGRLRAILGYWPLRPFGPAREPPPVRKEARVNGVRVTLAGLVGRVNAVLFTAEDLQLVLGPPSRRRRFLDILISQSDRSYLRALQRYGHVLTQRNHLLRALREGRAEPDELEFWDGELCEAGALVLRLRTVAVARLAPLVSDCYAHIAGKAEEVGLEYQTTVALSEGDDEKDAYARILRRVREREVAQGATLVGPHRDDLRLFINGADARTYSSRGQARTLALALRLAEARHLTHTRGEAPVVLLDDVLAELDGRRRTAVLTAVRQYEQTILTCTDLQVFPPRFLEGATLYEVGEGQVRRV